MAAELRTKVILIIDDMSSVRSNLRQMLATLGVPEVDFSSDGDEALRRMEARSYDIVLCDYNLGEGRDGMQIIEAAKQRNLIGLSTVFVMITAESTVAMVLGAVEYRPDDYLVKPITRQMLQERLGRLLDRKEILVDVERVTRQGDLARAVAMLGQHIQNKPEYAFDLMQIQTELLIRMGQFEAAGAVFEAAGGIREAFWVKLGKGQIRYYLGDSAGATKIFGGLIAENHLHSDAYDWLARVQQASGNWLAAKETLAAVTKIAPRSIRRAQTYGELSLRTGDTVAAEQAYRSAVRLGRFSVYGDPGDAARLGQVLIQRGNSKDASRVLKDARKQYHGNPRAALALAISEASVYHLINLGDVAVRVVDNAIEVYQDARDTLLPDLALELARLCHVYDRDVQAAAILTHVVLHHIEDSLVMEQTRGVFTLLGMAETGAKFISDLRTKVAAANNEGVRLIQEKKLHEGQVVLEKAAEDMPFNATININAARVLLMIMEKQGRRDDLLGRAKTYLDRVPEAQRINNDKFQRLLGLWTKLSGQAAPLLDTATPRP